MKKDINIPKVKDVYVAAVKEFNKEFGAEEWNAYIINNREDAIEMVLIVSKGFDGEVKTSTMRHSIKELPPRSFAKIEFMEDQVLKLNNEFSVTFFAEGKVFDKKFLFRKNTINKKALQDVPLMAEKGVLLK